MSLSAIRSFRAAHTAAVLTVVVGLVVASTSLLNAQKGKPSPPPNAVGRVTFADGPGDQLTSDGGGAYEGATIYWSGTLFLDLSTLAGRSIGIDLDPAARTATAGGTIDHVAPGHYATDSVLRIDTMATAPANGDWVRSVGRIGFGTSLPNHAMGFRYATANGVPIYGSEVCVRRVPGASPATWIVASSDACSLDQGQAGLFEEGLKGKGYRFEAVYTLKFLITVVCTSGSTCPQ